MKLLLPLFIASVAAVPGRDNIFKRAACNADNCLRAVRATSASPFASSATADCSRFQVTTVTPCPVTITTTTSTTVTGPVSFVTISTTVDSTTTTVSTSTIDLTATSTQTSTTVTTSTSLSTVTVTANAKRDIKALPAAITAPGQLDARAVTTCSASSTSSTSTPVYASACSGTVRYASACSCAGIPSSQTTLAAQTVTATATSTSTVTPVSTVTMTSTSVIVVTAQTSISTTVATATTTTVTTSTTTADTTATVTAACSAYQFVITSGSLAGQYVTGDSPDNAIPYGFVTEDGNAASAIPFTIRSDGTVYGNNVDRWITRANQLYYVLQSEDQYANAYKIDNVLCSVTSNTGVFPGATGALTCTSGGHSINFYQCPSTGNNLVQGTDGNSAGYGCSSFTLAAIPAC